MAPHSSTLAWQIPWMEEPGRLPSMGSQVRTRLKQLSSSSSIHVYKMLQKNLNEIFPNPLLYMYIYINNSLLSEMIYLCVR